MCEAREHKEYIWKSGVRFNWKSYTTFGPSHPPCIVMSLSLARFNATGSAATPLARAFDGQIPTNYQSRRDFPAIMPTDGRQIVSECFQTSSSLHYWPVDLSKSSLRLGRQWLLDEWNDATKALSQLLRAARAEAIISSGSGGQERLCCLGAFETIRGPNFISRLWIMLIQQCTAENFVRVYKYWPTYLKLKFCIAKSSCLLVGRSI